MITSLHNPLVKKCRKLHKTKGRQEEGCFLLEGTHLIEEALNTNYPLDLVCFTLEWMNKYPKLIARLTELSIKCELVSSEVIQAIATTVVPSGIVAIAPREVIGDSLFPITRIGLLLEGLQDPGNLGTIIRTAAATKIDGLIVSANTVDLDNPKVVRGSAGQWFKVNKRISDDLVETIRVYQSQGIQIVATLPDSANSYWDLNWKTPSLVLLGNEGGGLSDDLIKLTDHQVKIPLAVGVESLNVGISAALILYEALRQSQIILNKRS